jgi:hypothetical protein
MNSKIRKQILSLNFILKSRNVIYTLSQYKYMLYNKLNEAVKDIVSTDKDNLSSIENKFIIIFLDNKTSSVLDKITSYITQKIKVFVVCIYRNYNFLIQKTNIDPSFVFTIELKQIYELKINHLSNDIYTVIMKKMERSCKSIEIINYPIDNSVLVIFKNSKQDFSNMDGSITNVDSIIIGRYVLFMLSIFMSKYFLLEIGKNKQARDKIENKIKYLKLQLLNQDVVIKKNTDYE